jgi:hypothetical protein
MLDRGNVGSISKSSVIPAFSLSGSGFNGQCLPISRRFHGEHPRYDSHQLVPVHQALILLSFLFIVAIPAGIVELVVSARCLGVGGRRMMQYAARREVMNSWASTPAPSEEALAIHCGSSRPPLDTTDSSCMADKTVSVVARTNRCHDSTHQFLQNLTGMIPSSQRISQLSPFSCCVL